MTKRNLPGSKQNDKSYVVGIGASAGGLDAIQSLFDNMPGDTGFSFVIIQHLSPDHKSLLGEILTKHTTMQLFEAENGMTVEPDCVYVIPNKKTMTISEGVLLLKDKEPNRVPNNAIDIFFESLAKDQGNNAVGIILSGTGTDGTNGIEAIKANGGIVIVQEPSSAAFDGMPNSAISTGYADLVLPPEMIANELSEFLKESPFVKTFKALNKKEELVFREILEVIMERTGHDFSSYKLPTLSRRLAKRMFEKRASTISDYQKLLLTEPEEIEILSKEFLINVTQFFRDEEAFKLIKEKVIPAIFANKKEGDEVKIWVVACSTGEEAYSIAILVQEYLDTIQNHNYNIKIFATDIDQDALNTASKALYYKENVKDVSQERLQKYFLRDGDYYSVIPAIRKMVVFAKHDIQQDPPFSKIDLLSCRNMLIYMSPTLQKNIMRKFHFALNEDRYLFLGPSEHPAAILDYFKEVDKKWKIFKCIFKTKSYEDNRFINPLSKEALTPNTHRAKNALNNLAEIFKDTLMEEYNFAGIFIDQNFEVKQAIGNFKNFLRFPEGNFNFNLPKLLHPELAVAVNIAVRKAIKSGERTVQKNVKVIDGKTQHEINIIVKPYLQQKEYVQPFLFVILEETEKMIVKSSKKPQPKIYSSSERVLELEAELKEVRANLQSVIEEVESANEELQTSNEEIISSNEELQSTNEELQSLNEELHTVNAEHQMKIKELIELNDDLNNYFNNTDIGQILVDRNLVIRKFSPVATKQVNLIESDIGRSITDISTNLKNANLVEEVKEVLARGNDIEKEVLMTDDKPYLMRIRPFVRQDKILDGVVVNFIDVFEMKRLSSIIESVFNNSPNSIIALRAVRNEKNKIADFELVAINKNAEKFFGKTAEQLTGKMLLKNKLPLNNYFQQLNDVAQTDMKFQVEYWETHIDKWCELIATKMLDGVVITLCDINERKRASNLITESYDQLKRTSNELSVTIDKLEQSNFNLAQFASVASHDLKEPLRKIQIFGNMLKEKAYEKLEQPEKNYIDKMIGASNRMQILIDNVLAFSKLSNRDIEMVSSNLTHIIKEIIDDIEVTIKEKNATIHISELPTIAAKSGQMRQLFQNLISNALKFTNGKPPVVMVKEVKPTKEDLKALGNTADDYIAIEVSDNGIGFDEKYSNKIFELFQRLHGNNYQGTGLGLAICKKIVEDHNGIIKVKSKPGDGAKFIVLLPQRQYNSIMT
jgi:two-component system CheB/CheR fusion protein